MRKYLVKLVVMGRGVIEALLGDVRRPHHGSVTVHSSAGTHSFNDWDSYQRWREANKRKDAG